MPLTCVVLLIISFLSCEFTMAYVVKKKGNGVGVYLDRCDASNVAHHINGKLRGPFVTIKKAERVADARHDGHKTQYLGFKGSRNGNLRAIAYTDGCCLGNHLRMSDQGVAGRRAGFGVYWGHENSMTPYNGCWRLIGPQTPNRAAICAITEAVQIAKMKRFRSLVIRTDSQYAIDCATIWIEKWMKENWTKHKGHRVKNQQDLEDMYNAIVNFGKDRVLFEHVPVIDREYGLEQASRLARMGVGQVS